MKNTNNEQEKMTFKGWLYFGLFLALCCLIVVVAYALTQIVFGGWLFKVLF